MKLLVHSERVPRFPKVSQNFKSKGVFVEAFVRLLRALRDRALKAPLGFRVLRV